MPRPRSVTFPPARRPAQHRGVPGNAERSAQLGQYRSGVRENVVGVDDRWSMAEPVGLALEEFGLAIHPEILERGNLALAQIGGDHLPWVADQNCMPEALEMAM